MAKKKAAKNSKEYDAMLFDYIEKELGIKRKNISNKKEIKKDKV